MTKSNQELITPVEGGLVLLSKNGVYFQSELYQHGDELFAKIKGGFVRLLTAENTTGRGIKWKKIYGVPVVEQWNGPRLVKAKPTRKRAA